MASQSSFDDKMPWANADNAIDGNPDGNFRRKSVTHTLDKLNSWWQLEFPSTAMIEGIRIWNRTDDHVKRLSNFRISVLDEENNEIWSEYFKEPVNRSQPVKFDTPVKGQYVKVQLKGKNLEGKGILSLAEIQVFGKFMK